jgi:hypothetical protein
VSINPLYPLTEDEARELAGCLLTSSVIERYVRCLSNSNAAKRIAAELRAGTIDGNELLRYGWLYRALVYETPRRSEWELPLALIVFVLAQTGVRNVDNFLAALNASANPQSAWVAGLSRRMLRSRASSQIDTGGLLGVHRFGTSSFVNVAQSDVNVSAGVRNRAGRVRLVA